MHFIARKDILYDAQIVKIIPPVRSVDKTNHERTKKRKRNLTILNWVFTETTHVSDRNHMLHARIGDSYNF